MARRNAGKRAISIQELESTSFRELDFDGEWLTTMGRPELSGTILIYGPPKNGKTYFCLQFAKYLTRFARVAFNSLEMGTGSGLKRAINLVGYNEAERKRITLLDREPVAELIERLSKKKSQSIVFIDSIQYTGLTYREYIALKERFRNKLIVFVSHADGKSPRGEVARSVQYDADIIIHVEGFRATPKSRYGGSGYLTVWEEGAEGIW